MTTKQVLPAIEGWFTTGDEPTLLGSKCAACGSYVFPRATLACPNPDCAGSEFDEVPLSRTGRVWSFTTNHYAPPAPYMSPDPFRPYTVAAVELTDKRMVVLGQVVDGAELSVGAEVELVTDTLYEDDEATYVVWKWAPV
jgi:uncharacterized OB-fold protein